MQLIPTIVLADRLERYARNVKEQCCHYPGSIFTATKDERWFRQRVFAVWDTWCNERAEVALQGQLQPSGLLGLRIH